MTITNKAFIKAYRRDDVESVLAGPTLVESARPAGVAVGTTIEFVSGAVGGAPLSSIDALPNWATLPEAAYSTASTMRRQDKPTAARTERTPAPHQAAGQNIGKRPLSTFLSHPPATTPAPHARPTIGLRPGTTIASFRWPTVCRTLLQRCGNELDRAADRLTATPSTRLIGVLGLHAGRGCTTALLCLAARLASRGKRIIVADANFRHPQLSPLLDAKPTTAWEECPEHGTPIADAIVRATDDRLDLLGLGTGASTTTALAAVGRAQATGNALRAAYDIALVDLGAFFHAESQPILLKLTRTMRLDCVVAVAGPDQADPRDLAALHEHLQRIECGLVGTIENRVNKLTSDL